MRNFICWIIGHRYFVVKKFSRYARKVGCHRCKKQWAMHDPTKSFLEWDGEFEELYDDKKM